MDCYFQQTSLHQLSLWIPRPDPSNPATKQRATQLRPICRVQVRRASYFGPHEVVALRRRRGAGSTTHGASGPKHQFGAQKNCRQIRSRWAAQNLQGKDLTKIFVGFTVALFETTSRVCRTFPQQARDGPSWSQLLNAHNSTLDTLEGPLFWLYEYLCMGRCSWPVITCSCRDFGCRPIIMVITMVNHALISWDLTPTYHGLYPSQADALQFRSSIFFSIFTWTPKALPLTMKGGNGSQCENDHWYGNWRVESSLVGFHAGTTHW